MWIYSEIITNEKVTFVVHPAGANAHKYGFYFIDLTVNWTGWRKLIFPTDSFKTFGDPSGWNKIDSIAFYTKIFDRQPNPYTVLYFDDISLNPK